MAGKTGGESKAKSSIVAGHVEIGSAMNGKKGAKVVKRDATTDVARIQKLLRECEVRP
jgi:hypothetical protein